ncbi:MAG: D-alanyl-D-alanine carboxypeptidase [Clostridia bacterium]|nr:D-alanyl-D-alanine carboxypeptidase [Clostridia bacterium]
MKRILAVCLSLLFLLSFVPSLRSAQADSFDLNSIYEPYFILVNAEDPTVAYKGIEKEADKQIFPASTTKILSCIVALENGNLDDMVTVSAKAVDFGRGNSLMGLEEGDSYSMRDLLYGMMLPSGNDAAIAIAEHIAGSTDAFAEMMNEKAQSLGMTHSHFVTVHGKQNDNHYTTVRDMALLTAYALKNDTFRTIVSTKTYVAQSGPRTIELLNSNRLLVDTPPTETLPSPASCLYEYAIGVKTGDTTAAGKCLIAAAERDGITLIAVVYGGTLNDPDYDPNASDQRRDKFNAYRFQDAIKLFEYAYQEMTHTLTVSDLIGYGMPVEFDVTISNASENDSQGGVLKVRADLSEDTTITMMEPTLNGIRSNMAAVANPTFTNIYAPIGDGSIIGSVTYSYGGNVFLSANLLATRSVKEGSAQIDMTQQTSSSTGSLIGEANTSTVIVGEPEPAGNCSVPQDMRWVLIVLPVIFVLLILCVTLFIVYLNAESKRRKREAARRKAAKRARESGGYQRQ